MNDYEKLAQAIILQQENIVGPLSWNEAQKVSNLDTKGDKVFIKGDGKSVLENLVKQYETLFGKASVEACKDAVRPIMKDVKVELPESLK